MRRGVSLVELLFVLAVVGILAGVVVPGSAHLADRLIVEQEVARLLSAHRSAWHAAAGRHRIAMLRITPDTLAIRTVRSAGDPDTVLAWIGPGPRAAGVTLASAPHTTTFGPDGIGMGLSNARHILRRGSAQREIVVSRLGRVRVQ